MIPFIATALKSIVFKKITEEIFQEDLEKETVTKYTPRKAPAALIFVVLMVLLANEYFELNLPVKQFLDLLTNNSW